MSVCLRTKWFWVRVQLQSLKPTADFDFYFFFVGTKGNQHDIYYLPVRQSLLNMMDINR